MGYGNNPALGLIFLFFIYLFFLKGLISFSFWLFHDVRKYLCFKTNNLISYSKVWWGNTANMQYLFQRISGSAKWPQNLNPELSFKSESQK